MTRTEIDAMIADRPGRTAIVVREQGANFVAEWDGKEYRAGNPFGLDSQLTQGGVPAPRDLYLIDPAA